MYWAAAHAVEWNAVYCRVELDQVMSGLVVLKSSSGWVDLGLGFPAVVTASEYPELSLCVGERFTGRVSSFRLLKREVVLAPVVVAVNPA